MSFATSDQRERLHEKRSGKKESIIAAVQHAMLFTMSLDEMEKLFINSGNSEGDLLAVATSTDPPGGSGKKNLVEGNTVKKVPRPESKGWGKSKEKKSFWKSHGFSFGLRYNNIVILDVNVGTFKAPFEGGPRILGGGARHTDHFPGREVTIDGRSGNSTNSFQMFYRVQSDNSSYLNRYHPFFLGGKFYFIHCCRDANVRW